MINDNLTVSVVDLNGGTEKELDAIKPASSTTMFGNNTKDLHPKRIQINNDTGIDIDIDFILTTDEYALWTANKASWKYFELRSGQNLAINSFSPLPNAYKIIVKGTNGTATKDLRVDLIAFTPNL